MSFFPGQHLYMANWFAYYHTFTISLAMALYDKNYHTRPKMYDLIVWAIVQWLSAYGVHLSLMDQILFHAEARHFVNVETLSCLVCHWWYT